LPLRKDDIVEAVTKDDGGWWLIKKGNSEGWVPSNVSLGWDFLRERDRLHS
jgi:hypothetical protein